MIPDNDIKKALECCIKDDCDNCPDTFGNCEHNVMRNALDLINRLEKENNDLFLELEGVMWSVDKWLDGDELKQDKVNRAITMREKTLQITEKQQAEIERLKAENEVMKTNCNSMYVSMPNMAKAERTEAIKEFAERLKDLTTSITLGGKYRYDVATKECIDYLVKEMTEVSEDAKN